MNKSPITLSICITLKNRSAWKIATGQVLYLFPNCVKSIAKSIFPEDGIEVVICDWGSTDWPPNRWIGEKLKEIPFSLVQASGDFHRGTGRNVAASYAKGKYLFFLDADMILNRTVVLNGLKMVENNCAYYPICFYFLDPKHKTGFWCVGGRGIVMMKKEMFLKAGKWPCPPHYQRHFDEDQAFHKQVIHAGIKFKVEKEPGYFHQYHPGKSVDTILKKRRHLIEPFTQIPSEK